METDSRLLWQPLTKPLTRATVSSLSGGRMEGTLGGNEPFHQPFKGHITWHFPGRDHKMLLEVSFQHRNVFHSPILKDKPSFLFHSEGGISPLPPVGRCHPVNLKTDLVEVEDEFVAISYPKTPQRINFFVKIYACANEFTFNTLSG